MNIGLAEAERSRLEKVLHTADDLPLALFKPAQVRCSARAQSGV